MTELRRALVIDASDNVATTLADLSAGDEVTVEQGKTRTTLTVAENVPYGHKFAIADIDAGAEVRKYGAPIGLSRGAIAKGTHVHTHNVDSQRGRGDLT